MEFDPQKRLQRLRGQNMLGTQPAFQKPVQYSYREQIPCYEFSIPLMSQISCEVTLKQLDKQKQQTNTQKDQYIGTTTRNSEYQKNGITKSFANYK